MAVEARDLGRGAINPLMAIEHPGYYAMVVSSFVGEKPELSQGQTTQVEVIKPGKRENSEPRPVKIVPDKDPWKDWLVAPGRSAQRVLRSAVGGVRRIVL